MIQSVDRAARILQALAARPGRLGVSELSQRLGLAKGTVHGLLRTLQSHGLVEQHRDSDKYQLGPELLQLSYRYLDLNELRARSLVWADRLATRATESVRVGALRGDTVLIVHHAFRPDTSLQILEVGEVLPLHATALGKAVLAYLPLDARAGLLEDRLSRLTGHTLATADLLERDLEETRGRGYAIEREEAVLGEAGLAAPIFDRTGEVIGSVGIAAPGERLAKRRIEREIAPAVLEAARGISRDLGATAWPSAPDVAAIRASG
jgi:DNA-binding IclR family transcriptional regulator